MESIPDFPQNLGKLTVHLTNYTRKPRKSRNSPISRNNKIRMSQTFPETVSETLTSLQWRGPCMLRPLLLLLLLLPPAPGHETNQAAEIQWDDDDGDIAGDVELEGQTMEEEDEPTE